MSLELPGDWVSFPYVKKVATSPLRPYVPFQARSSSGIILNNLAAVADTGAERTLLITDFAHALGIQLLESTKESVTGFGEEKLSGYPADIEVMVDGMSGWVPMRVYFVEGMTVSGLFGQASFFSKFKAVFERDKEIFHLNKLPTLDFE